MRFEVLQHWKQRQAGIDKLGVMFERLDQLHEEVEQIHRQLESLETQHQERPAGSKKDPSPPQSSKTADLDPDYWIG